VKFFHAGVTAEFKAKLRFSPAPPNLTVVTQRWPGTLEDRELTRIARGFSSRAAISSWLGTRSAFGKTMCFKFRTSREVPRN
jgi:hypothetical protein